MCYYLDEMGTLTRDVAAATFLFLAVLGCGGGAKSPAHSGPPFLGRWTAQLPGAPCPFDVELMAGGAARMNFLNDDSPQELCSHRSVSFEAGSLAPDAMLFFSGDRPVRHCWFAASGSSLDLACDEHGLPPRGTPPIRFSRVEEPAAPTEGASLLGDWNDGGTRFSFLAGGICVVGGRQIGYRIVNARELELLWPRPERCAYEFRGKNELLIGCQSMSLDLRR